MSGEYYIIILEWMFIIPNLYSVYLSQPYFILFFYSQPGIYYIHIFFFLDHKKKYDTIQWLSGFLLSYFHVASVIFDNLDPIMQEVLLSLVFLRHSSYPSVPTL